MVENNCKSPVREMILEITNLKPEADATLVRNMLLMRKLSKIAAFENEEAQNSKKE
jgi:hypothetical protein